jgi:hypothetical protein
MIRNLTAIGKTMLLPYLFILFLLVVPNTSFAQRKLNAAANTTKSSTSPKEAQATRDKSKNNDVDHSTLDFKKGAIFGKFSPQDEIVEKRTKSTKHFKNGDGSISAFTVSGGDLNYLSNGAWKSIDRTISANTTKRHSQYPYTNNKNRFATYYAQNASQGILLEFKEGIVKEGLNKKLVWLDANHNIISSVDINNTRASAFEDKITYSNVFNGVDLEYHQLNDGKKMDYVLKNSSILNQAPTNAKYLAFAEDIILPANSSSKQIKNEDGNIINLDVFANGTYMMRYDLPRHYDSGNKETTSYYRLKENTLLTIVDMEWLNSGLTFPVIIDPTTTVYPTGSGDYNTGVIDANQLITRNNDIYVGMRYAYGASSGSRRFFRGYMSFNVTSIPDQATIDNVVFGCYIGLNTFDAYYGEYARCVEKILLINYFQ